MIPSRDTAFEKWEAAGNDFILVERDLLPPGADPGCDNHDSFRRHPVPCEDAFGDGRDTSPESGARFIREVEALVAQVEAVGVGIPSTVWVHAQFGQLPSASPANGCQKRRATTG